MRHGRNESLGRFEESIGVFVLENKMLLVVRLPATLQDYEFLVPLDLTVEEGARLVARLLAAREPARYEMSPDVDLMRLEGDATGAVVNPKETFRSLRLSHELVDGSRLMLV